MKNKNIFDLIVFVIVLVLLMIVEINFISAEVYLYDTVLRDNITSTENFHSFVQFQDTSVIGIGANQDTVLTYWYTVQALPITNISSGEVDWCNFTIKQYRNSTLFNSINYYFANSSYNSSQVIFLMRDKDSITADMKCHYTNFSVIGHGSNGIAGDFNIYMSSYQCLQCSDFTLEQLSNEAQRNENITKNNIGIYNSIQKVVDFNFQIWLIISWILKIGFIFVAVALIFAGVYYFYVLFSNIGKELQK